VLPVFFIASFHIIFIIPMHKVCRYSHNIVYLLFKRQKTCYVNLVIINQSVAGAASVFGNTPVDVIKTKLQGLEAHKYKGVWDCAKKTLAEDGLIGIACMHCVMCDL